MTTPAFTRDERQVLLATGASRVDQCGLLKRGRASSVYDAVPRANGSALFSLGALTLDCTQRVVIHVRYPETATSPRRSAARGRCSPVYDARRPSGENAQRPPARNPITWSPGGLASRLLTRRLSRVADGPANALAVVKSTRPIDHLRYRGPAIGAFRRTAAEKLEASVTYHQTACTARRAPASRQIRTRSRGRMLLRAQCGERRGARALDSFRRGERIGATETRNAPATRTHPTVGRGRKKWRHF